ncbi:putative acyl-CoA dehydrogenase domain protein [Burkholderia oklahomensis]|uniref:Acyl-CoA dehydrogenase domain protein n=1 Tax=Burkholderia oklahomensis TaxID=342113 RepID=A0AAI8BCM6_9BURK|nr:putative acyl-CoA dehydrogenase domain protein [Burkholderia oklahomensis]AOI39755.1 acyl-CoA dehydrogenase [Burkholderia oklahomensis EO147]KUY67701.1 acyl-CoA dehydrogenase [Burkholderia oklahomensis EO147]QPS39895.1 acyl-CoA dehydrogenase [Burkholderia oklahomensis]
MNAITQPSVARAARRLSNDAEAIDAARTFAAMIAPDAAALDRHWRNARTHTLHDPVCWKYIAIADYYLNDAPPPRHGAL